MKKLIMVTMVAACLALCATVWPQATPAVTATQPDIPELPAVEEFISSEEEKAEIPQPELLHEVIPTPELVPEEIAAPPKHSRYQNQNRNPFLHLLYHKRLPNHSPVAWSMSPDSAGWNPKAQARSSTLKICTRTAIKSVARDK